MSFFDALFYSKQMTDRSIDALIDITRVDSGGGVSLISERHAALSISRSRQKHDQWRLRILHVLQPLLGHAHRNAVGRIQYGQRRRQQTTEGVLRSQTGSI